MTTRRKAPPLPDQLHDALAGIAIPLLTFAWIFAVGVGFILWTSVEYRTWDLVLIVLMVGVPIACTARAAHLVLAEFQRQVSAYPPRHKLHKGVGR